tara:strand:- start:472 stop:687 length:216 start_codon:yes stop_codon:yes gene_type:complete
MVVAAVTASLALVFIVIVAAHVLLGWHIREERRDLRRAENERAVKWENFAAEHSTSFQDAYEQHYANRKDS